MIDLGSLDRESCLQLGAVVLFLWASWKLLRHTPEKPAYRSVAVLVLGDVGRSPRMMYHAESFARLGFQTFVVGYEGSTPPASLRSEPLVHWRYLPQPPRILALLPFLLLAPIKILHQVSTILFTFLVDIDPPPEFIIVQNPPSIPTLALVWLVSKLRGCKVIIDWHNLGYTILALKLGDNHILVRAAAKFEATFGRTAYAHLFVTEAMREHLVHEWDLQPFFMIGRPAHFHRASPPETHELLLRLKPPLALHPALSSFLPSSEAPYSTPFTRVSASADPSTSSTGAARTHESANTYATFTDATLAGAAGTTNAHAPPALAMPALRADRPALLVSSTSWTADEDFSILLEALARYEARARTVNEGEIGNGGGNGAGDGQRSAGALPRVLVVVTGKGPLRERYMSEVERLQRGKGDGASAEDGWRWVRCVSLWLEAEDYPLLLGSADLGVCLHASSSALDLPMKVVDMFGCGLPVCALDFACLHELVKDGQNGLVFTNAEQLAEQFVTLLTGFPHSKALDTLRASLVKGATPPFVTLGRRRSGGLEGAHWEWNTWAENWDRVVKPLVLSDAERNEW